MDANLGVMSGGSILTKSTDDFNSFNNHIMSIEDSSSSYPIVVVDDDDDDDGDLELGLGLRIGGGFKTKEEYSSSSSSSVNIPNSSILGTKRTAFDSDHPPNSTSVIGWPPINKAHRMPIVVSRIKSEHDEFSSRAKRNSHHLSIKVNMDGTLIGRKVDLYAHTSYETLAHTLEDMFFGNRCSRLLNETSEFVLTYEDKDGDCMLVGDVPWEMFLSSVKRLRILRNPNST